ncbi:ABC transporter permease [Bacillus glycinifermentans]|uniref:ABC transporter permease n=1 Tax=Bacillus glycinifermentans TaxID=1664069 RepID=UPI002DBD0773|nr:ABC transporter permease [Bacillus glycinifermentans]MEC0494186.1 ABC transporter permease [Bacillus glycinifermentans]MEC0540601.1 ABC transporter permease [Bacillus glycinifermentans]
MNALVKVLKEVFSSLPLIMRLAVYETKSKYQMNYLGVVWQFLNPLIQILAYWFVFGTGIKGARADVDHYPFIIWMLAGIIPWFFISPTILDGSNSVYKRINLVSKMNFPISSLPAVVIASNLFSYLAMTFIYVLILLGSGHFPTLHWLQYFYFLFCMLAFMFSFSLLNSTISVLVRDYQFLLQAGTRLLFFLMPIFWDVAHSLANRPHVLAVLKLNPLFYIIDGFRNSFLNGRWFFEDINYTLYFWLFTLLLLTVGSILHMKFRDKFVDFL